MASSANSTAPAPRRYDKGDRRHKHSGRTASARIDEGNPRKVVGKCPNNIGQSKRETLLQHAIAPRPGNSNLGYHKRLYLTHLGVIYEFQTSDCGETYHAYPYHGLLTRSLRDRLSVEQDAKAHPVAFLDWVRDHITLQG